MALDDFLNSFKDSYSSLRERFNSPFYLSFVISWIIYNWRIIVALFWYDPSQIDAEGYGSIYGFIYHNINISNILFYPFIWGCLFSILNPFFRYGPALISSMVSKYSENFYLKKIQPNSSISIERHLQLSKGIEEKQNELNRVLERIKEIDGEKLELDNKISKANREIELLKESIRKNLDVIHKTRDITILNGEWEFEFKGAQYSGKQKIEINNGKWYIIESFGAKTHTSNIINFTYDDRNKSIFFVKQNILTKHEKRPYLFINISIKRSGIMIGEEVSPIDKSIFKVEFRKQG